MTFGAIVAMVIGGNVCSKLFNVSSGMKNLMYKLSLTSPGLLVGGNLHPPPQTRDRRG